MKILMIQEDRTSASSLKVPLQEKGFLVECIHEREDGEMCALTGIYDLLILDGTLPGLDGYRLVREVRDRRSSTPIVILSRQWDTEDRIRGLNAGADYLLPKPADPREVLACITALLRRQNISSEELCMGNTTLDLSTGSLICGDQTIRLSAKEFEMMRFFLQSKGAILSKEMLLARIWGYDSNAVENHAEVYIGFLRKKLRSIGSNLRIDVRRRLGYCLVVDSSPQATSH